jgi:hypothetical protein
MKLVFYSSTENINTGSYRIWVNDLNRSMNEIGVDSRIVYYDVKKIDPDADVVIFCKSSYNQVDYFKEINKNAKIGAINVAKDYYNDNIDFVIAGSPEEYTSLSYYKNVFIYPLIERKFESIERKIHNNDNDILNVCFHGHYPHLFKFQPFLKDALEYFNKEIKKVKLTVITGHPEFDWKVGKPDIEIKMLNYDENISKYIKECDIGLVPNVSDLRLFVDNLEKLTSVDYGLYDTDYFMRYKNKTNAGRAYVFYQHGIPVIHDLSPSSFELMKITDFNVCAHDKNSWLRELNFLANHVNRENISLAYYNAFKEHYNPRELASKLIKKLENI